MVLLASISVISGLYELFFIHELLLFIRELREMNELLFFVRELRELNELFFAFKLAELADYFLFLLVDSVSLIIQVVLLKESQVNSSVLRPYDYPSSIDPY